MKKIGVFSPASAVSHEQIQKAVQTLEKWGYEIYIHSQTFIQNAQFAGTIQERLSAFQELLNDTSIDIIWCSRGGYGVVQWIDSIDFSPLIKKFKYIVGFSDVTVLHCALQKIGLKSLHAPMLKGWENLSSQTLKYLEKALQNTQIEYKVENSPFDRLGKAKGKLIGGNIALLHNQIGTKTDFDTKNAILFLEDINEPLYNLDRMLRHLQRAGKFENLQGLIVGNISRIKPEEPPFDKNIYEIITEIVEPYQFPICYDFPIGHESENYPIVCGSEAILEVSLSGVSLVQKWS